MTQTAPSGLDGIKLSARGLRVEFWQERSRRGFVAVDGVNLDVREGEFVAIVGPSGCGKTTFLNAVDGLIPISAGSLWLGGKPIKGPDHDRAMVFQHPSLLPWRTVLANVAYGLEIQRKVKKADARQRAREFVHLVGLDGFEEHFPLELSGGMQQRVNLARALATDPELLLLDEPFAALDAQTREYMQLELLRIWRQTSKTAIFITHDIKEAIYLADRVFVFSARPGRVKLTLEIALPRPRELRVKRTAEFVEYEDKVWSAIEEESVLGKEPALVAG